MIEKQYVGTDYVNLKIFQNYSGVQIKFPEFLKVQILKIAF